MRNYFLVFCSLLLLLNCSCGYRADRFDEHLITEQSNHFNLYRNVPLEILGTPGSPEKVSDQALVRKMTEGENLLSERTKILFLSCLLFLSGLPLWFISIRNSAEKKRRNFYCPSLWFSGILGRSDRRKMEIAFFKYSSLCGPIPFSRS